MKPVILFDFFGVFQDDPLKVWIAKHGFSRDGEIADASYQLDIDQISYREYLERLAPLSQQTADELFQEIESTGRSNQELIEYARTLAQTYRVALISNASRQEIEPLLTQNNLQSLFDPLIVSSDVGVAKPDPKIFEYAFDKMNVESKQVIFVDDTTDNVAAGKALGMQGIVFENNQQLKDELEPLLSKWGS